MRRIVEGLAARRSSRPAHSMNEGSLCWLGATEPATQPSPQCASSSSMCASRISAGQAHS